MTPSHADPALLGSMEALVDRLERAERALGQLIAEAKEGHSFSEVDRLNAKREGVWLALSYAREEIALQNRGE